LGLADSLVVIMPRTQKPAGQAVDRRNGRRADLDLVPGQPLVKPEPSPSLCEEARAQWDAYWESTAAAVQTAADRGVVLRWVDAVDRYLRTLGEADQQPLVTGSTGQLVENPLYKIAAAALGTVERCEKQMGIGALNRAGLGIAVIAEQRSLADMNSRYGGGADGGTDPAEVEEDPRLTVIDGEVG
jgi:P27 family predicted phage terminase small subunit